LSVSLAGGGGSRSFQCMVCERRRGVCLTDEVSMCRG